MYFDNSDEIERLKKELEKVTIERDRLLAENNYLRQFTKSKQDPNQIKPDNSVKVKSTVITTIKQEISSFPNNYESISPEKVQPYKSLFRGREDVYARLWQNKNTLKSGYSPVCKNEWVSGLCQKFKVKCTDCPNRELSPLTDLVIQNHLEGKFTIGIYPLLKDDTCHLLAIDFDKRTWMEDSAAFCETCHGMGIPAALERSRSVNGAHVWIFFSEAAPASVARNLGSCLITRTMS